MNRTPIVFSALRTSHSRRGVLLTIGGLNCLRTSIGRGGSVGKGGLGLACRVVPNRQCAMEGVHCLVTSALIRGVIRRRTTSSLLGPNVPFSLGILSDRHNHVDSHLRGDKCCGFGGRCIHFRMSSTINGRQISLSILIPLCQTAIGDRPIPRPMCGVHDITFSRSTETFRTPLRIANLSDIIQRKFPVCCGGEVSFQPTICAEGGIVQPKDLCGRTSMRHACDGFKRLNTIVFSGVGVIRHSAARGLLSYRVAMRGGGAHSIKTRLRKAGSTKSLNTTLLLACRGQGLFENSRLFFLGLHKTFRTVAKVRKCVSRGCVRTDIRTNLAFPGLHLFNVGNHAHKLAHSSSRISLVCSSRGHPRFRHEILASTLHCH